MKEIQLYKGRINNRSPLIGKILLIDDEDFCLVSSYGHWFIDKHGYVISRNTKLHIMLCPSVKPFVTDHINRNKLDNRRSNLRSVNRRISNVNRAFNSKFGYRGVLKYGSGYAAQIQINGTKLLSGFCHTIEEAAIAYNELLMLYYPTETHLINIIKPFNENCTLRQTNKPLILNGNNNGEHKQ